MGNLLTVSAINEKFISCLNLNQNNRENMNTIPPSHSLTQEKALRLFLQLPTKVLPLNKAERVLAQENEEIVISTKGNKTRVKWQSSPSSKN